MAIRIDERFEIDAPTGAVWDFLVDPRRVVACVPGGELLGVGGDGTIDGRIRVAVGPLTFAYGGRVRLAVADAAARHVRIVGQARERSGSGAARLTLESWVLERPFDRSEVLAVARLDAGGRLLELGRGLLGRLAHVVFQDFAAAVRAAVEAEAAAPGQRLAITPAMAPPLRAVPVVLEALGSWLAEWLRPGER